MSAAENIATSNNAPAVQFGSNGDAIAPTPSMPTGGFYDSFNQQQADASMLADLADQGVSLTPKPKANDGDGIIDVKMTAPVSTAEAAAGQLSPLGVMARDAAAPKPLSPLGVMARDAAAPRGENAAAMTNTQSAVAPTPIVPEKNVVNAKAENATTEKTKYAAEKTPSAPTKYSTGEWSSEDTDKSKNTSKKTEKKSQNPALKSETKSKTEPEAKQVKNYSSFQPDLLPENAEKKEDTLPENAEKKEDTPRSLAEVMKRAEAPSPEANAPAPAENKPVESEAERKARIEAEAAAKREADAQWRRERAEEEKGMTAEQKIENRMKAQQRGHKVFDAQGNINMLVSEKISDKQAEKEAASVTYRALKENEDALKAKRAEKAKAKAEKSQLLKNHKLLKAGIDMAKAIPVGFLDRTVGVVKRSFTARDYYKTAAEAIKATGNLSSGQAAIDELRTAIGNKEKFKGRREAVVERVKDAQKGMSLDLFNATSQEEIDRASGLIDPDKAVIERAEQAIRAGDSIVKDKGIEFIDIDAEKKDKLTKDLQEYAQLVAGWDVDKAELSKEEKASRDAARENIINAINEATGGSISNAAEMVRLIEYGLGGLFKDEMNPDHAEHGAATKAINDYVKDHFKLQGFRVKDSGLALDEGRVVNKTDKLTVKSNVLIGIAVGLGGSFATGIAKNTLIQRVTNSQLVMAGAKVLVAGAIGGVRGYKKTKTQQLKANIDAALGIKSEGKKNANKANMNALMMNAREITDALNSGELSNEDTIKMMGEVLARLDFQEAKRDKKGRGQVNLFEYEGKDKIERGKAELFDAMNNVAERLRAAGIDVEAEFGRAKRMQYQKLERDYNAIMKAELKDRWKAAKTSALIAAGAAAVATVVWDEVRHGGKIWKEFKDVFITKRRKFSGLHVVDVNDEAAIMAGVANGQRAGQQAEEQMRQNANKGPINQEHGRNIANAEKTPEQMELERRANAQVLIEDDPDGKGQIIGFDKNNNGKIDAGENLFDKDGDGNIDAEYLTANGGRGYTVNLNDKSELAWVNEELKENGVSIERSASVIKSAKEVTADEFVRNQKNAVAINSDKVNWDKSEQLCAVENNSQYYAGDGTELVEIHVSGKVPEGAGLYIDLDGSGPLAPLGYTIKDGRALVPRELVTVRSDGTIVLNGVSRVAKIEDGQFISYTTNIGKTVNANDMIKTEVEETGSILTVLKRGTNGEEIRINQAALDANGKTLNNLSETFNGRSNAAGYNSLPYMMNEVTHPEEEMKRLANGVKLPDYEYHGGYHAPFDASENTPFILKSSYVSTPTVLDANGDGIIDANETADYINQMFVRTATNPYTLAQNASVYGLLEP